MKLIALALLGLVCVSYQTPLKVGFDYQKEFENYIQKFNKNYENDAEKAKRFNVFVENVNNMFEYQKAHPKTQFAINKYSDWTKEEKAKLTGLKVSPSDTFPRPKPISTVKSAVKDKIPANFDWRQRNMVTPVKDQGQCGSCWTFQTIAVVESNVLLNGKPQILLSEQEIVDCDHIGGTAGCDGGTGNSGLMYIKKNGVETEKEYPYRAITQTCRANYKLTDRTSIKDFVLLGPNVDDAAYNITQLGPVGFNIWVPDSLFGYDGGVWSPSEAECLRAEREAAGHAITIVGFGTQSDGTEYWIIKNSWGADWGNQGYFNMIRTPKLTCAIIYENMNLPVGVSGYFMGAV